MSCSHTDISEKPKPKKKAPGKSFRKGLSLVELVRMFPDDETAERWLVDRRWPERVVCPKCRHDSVQRRAKHKTMPFRCRGCGGRFSVRTGTVMESSNLGYQTWVLAIYIVATSLKGVSSMKLHRDLGIGQKAAWFLLHRLREAMATGHPVFSSPVEADETYVGGLEKNKHRDKKMTAAGGPVGKAIVAGVRERATGQVVARVVPDTSAGTLTGMVADHTDPSAQVFTDEARGYRPLSRMGYQHSAVKHSVGQYVDGQAHTNGLESFWAMLKRGYHGTYHQVSFEHLDRYVAEFSGRHNIRPLHTIDQMQTIASNMDGKRLTYKALIKDGVHANRRKTETLEATTI